MAGPAFDERYDPRFQRGFDGAADASGGTDDSGGPQPEPAAAAAAPPDAAPDPAAPGASDRGVDGASDGVEATADEPEIEPESSRRWLWVAFGICAAAAVGSVWLFWASVTERSRFNAPDASAWAYLAAILEPVLLEFGLTGAALIAVWLGLRQRARLGVGLLHVPAVIGLAAGAAAAALVLIWAGASVSPVVFWSGDPSLWTAQERSESALAELRMAVVGPAVRAGLVALAGIALVGAAGAARSARPSGEASGAMDGRAASR